MTYTIDPTTQCLTVIEHALSSGTQVFDTMSNPAASQLFEHDFMQPLHESWLGKVTYQVGQPESEDRNEEHSSSNGGIGLIFCQTIVCEHTRDMLLLLLFTFSHFTVFAHPRTGRHKYLSPSSLPFFTLCSIFPSMCPALLL